MAKNRNWLRHFDESLPHNISIKAVKRFMEYGEVHLEPYVNWTLLYISVLKIVTARHFPGRIPFGV
jgi:hypothetical protein